MQSSYSIAEAQAVLPALVKEAQDDLVIITRREKTVAYLISAERMAGIAETLEIMADPQAMAAVHKARRGKGRYFPLSALNEG